MGSRNGPEKGHDLAEGLWPSISPRLTPWFGPKLQVTGFIFVQLDKDKRGKGPINWSQRTIMWNRCSEGTDSTFSFAFDSHVFGNQKQINGVKTD